MSPRGKKVELPADWWTAEDCAAYLDITPSTWRAYVSREQAPQPERMFGRSPTWRPATIKAWAADRPHRAK
jgi:predicted DNA-binding transcriptional regulator AlpA